MKKQIVAILGAAGLTGCLSVQVPEDNFFYPETRLEAERITLEDSAPWPGAVERLTIPTDGGPVAAAFIPGQTEGGPLILYCGGNLFRMRSHLAYAAEKLAPFGGAILFDYPGYGDTPGEADMASFRRVGTAVADYARARADADGRRLITWGHSLGGPVCAEIAAHSRADAVVLETTTPTARAAVNQMVGLWRPLVRVQLAEPLETIDIPGALSGYGGRVVVLEAGRDDTLPAALSRTLARDLERNGVAVQRLVFPQAGHLDIAEQPDFRERLTTALSF